VTDFVAWQRDGSLRLNPDFQRRSVWKPGARSFFIDTVCRGLPAPVIYIRESIDITNQKSVRDIVDGQQRLRTLFAFIDPKLLDDYIEERDAFTVKRVHNSDLAGQRFKDLPIEMQRQILSYEFSTHILPLSVEDREVYQMFARLNSTGVRVNDQELRNATYFGEFKTLMYELALEQLDRWREWGIFTSGNIARMQEVELASDIALSAIKGLSGKNQSAIDGLYKHFDDEFLGKQVFRRRFRRVMDEIEALFDSLEGTAYSSQVIFFSLFVFLYDEMYGLETKLDSATPYKLSARLGTRLRRLGQKLDCGDVPEDVLDAIQRAPTNVGRRLIRHEYFGTLINA